MRKGLTLSPGLRYSYQTRVSDLAAFEPHFGMTWAPFPSGRTTLRASAGIFHGWLDPGIWWQTVRSDSQHQRDIIISNPSYPDPGTAEAIPVANTYRLGDYKLNQNYRYSAGIDQRFSPRAGVNLLYNYYNQSQLPRGTNLTGRQRRTPGSVVRRHYLDNWRRLALNGSYAYIRARRNALGPFDVPASGTLDTEWGRGPADNPYRVNVAVTSTQLRNLAVNLSVNAADGQPYMLMTGVRWQPGRSAERPAGWRRHPVTPRRQGVDDQQPVYLQPSARRVRRRGRAVPTALSHEHVCQHQQPDQPRQSGASAA